LEATVELVLMLIAYWRRMLLVQRDAGAEGRRLHLFMLSALLPIVKEWVFAAKPHRENNGDVGRFT